MKKRTGDTDESPTPAERRASMNWAQSLKRVFNIDIEICTEYGGATRVIAGIEDSAVIRKIPGHLSQKAGADQPDSLPPSRAPTGDLLA